MSKTEPYVSKWIGHEYYDPIVNESGNEFLEELNENLNLHSKNFAFFEGFSLKNIDGDKFIVITGNRIPKENIKEAIGIVRQFLEYDFGLYTKFNEEGIVWGERLTTNGYNSRREFSLFLEII
tara:strand:+ start:8869 stop:9237 length:369 start_codon:yes stop_codon:yes gene_type:complete